MSRLDVFLEADGFICQVDNRIVLQDVYIKIKRGEVVGLLGNSGSGKSILMEYISGVKSVDSGSVRINGNYIKPNNRYKHIQFLPQGSFIPSHLTINQALKDYGVLSEDIIQIFPLFKGRLNQKVKYLSAGEKRLLEVFIVIQSKSDFCLLDDPFNKLAPIHIQTLKQCIKNCSLNKGFLITENRDFYLSSFVNNLYEIKGGNLFEGSL